MKIEDTLWLWGQAPGSHHIAFPNLPGVNRMTPAEGAEYFGIPNVFSVVMGNQPAPPFDNAARELSGCRQVVWSIIGDKSSDRTDDGANDLDEVLKVSQKFPNITGGIMDDFLNPVRTAVFTPEVVKGFRDKLHEAGLSFWTVLYEQELRPEIIPYLELCDNITFWTWNPEALRDLEANVQRVRSMMKPEQKLYLGCYMWNYEADCELSVADMEYQLELCKRWISEGKISGIILCSNCIADIGLAASDFTKAWMDKNRNLEV